MSSNISSTIIQSWRERPPSSYSIKVENFSELKNSTLHSNGKYKSRRISSGDYKWRMVIYPKGNNNDNGSGFISMYVEIDDTSLISTPNHQEVYANIIFFVFNKKENKYHTIQDLEPKSFNTLRTVWGFPQVLSFDTFSDHKNGYLFDGDHCEFGIDIIVAPPPTKWEIISYDLKLPDPMFSWTVKNFVDIKESPYTSEVFSKGGKKCYITSCLYFIWFLMLYPKGYSSADRKWLSIFLCSAVDEILKDDEQIYVQAILKVKDPCGSNDLTRTINSWINKPGMGYGRDQLVSIDDLRKSYLDKEDTLKVEVEFKAVSATKYSSFT